MVWQLSFVPIVGKSSSTTDTGGKMKKTTDTEKSLKELEKWLYDELEPYFQGKYGRMDTMIEMFVTQTMERVDSLLSQAKREGKIELFNELYDTLNTDDLPMLNEENNLLFRGINLVKKLNQIRDDLKSQSEQTGKK